MHVVRHECPVDVLFRSSVSVSCPARPDVAGCSLSGLLPSCGGPSRGYKWSTRPYEGGELSCLSLHWYAPNVVSGSDRVEGVPRGPTTGTHTVQWGNTEGSKTWFFVPSVVEDPEGPSHPCHPLTVGARLGARLGTRPFVPSRGRLDRGSDPPSGPVRSETWGVQTHRKLGVGAPVTNNRPRGSVCPRVRVPPRVCSP